MLRDIKELIRTYRRIDEKLKYLEWLINIQRVQKLKNK